MSQKTGIRTTGFSVTNATENAKSFGRGAFESFDDFRRKINSREVMEGASSRRRQENHLQKRRWLEKSLNKLDRVCSFLLDLGDRPFFEMWFTNSINNQMRLNKVSEPSAEMIDVATQEALESVAGQ